jgi:hypothetical protein
MPNNKSPEEYRQLAAKCRQTARSVSAEKERAAHLLAMANTWDLLASRIGHTAQCETPAAVTGRSRNR